MKEIDEKAERLARLRREFNRGFAKGFRKNSNVEMEAKHLGRTALLSGSVEISECVISLSPSKMHPSWGDTCPVKLSLSPRDIAVHNRAYLRRSDGCNASGVTRGKNSHKAPGKRSGAYAERAKQAESAFVSEVDALHAARKAKETKSTKGFRQWCRRHGIDHKSI